MVSNKAGRQIGNKKMSKLQHAPKTVSLTSGEYLHFWYANNIGRGTDNCTIIRSTSAERAAASLKQTEVIATVRTSAWNGKVNFSANIQSALNLG